MIQNVDTSMTTHTWSQLGKLHLIATDFSGSKLCQLATISYGQIVFTEQAKTHDMCVLPASIQVDIVLWAAIINLRLTTPSYLTVFPLVKVCVTTGTVCL